MDEVKNLPQLDPEKELPSPEYGVNWNRVGALAGAFVVLAAIAYVAVWLGGGERTGDVNDAGSIEDTTVPAGEFAGWQTYRNEEFGFEFMYPETWSTYEKKSNEIRLWIEGVSKVDAQVAIEAYRSSDLSSSELENLIVSDEYNEPNKSIISNGGVKNSIVSSVTIDGVEGKKISGEGWLSQGTSPVIRIILEKNDVVYLISVDEAQDSLTPILNTFRFIFPDLNKNEKTYYNELVGFEITLPKEWEFLECFGGGQFFIYSKASLVEDCYGPRGFSSEFSGFVGKKVPESKDTEIIKAEGINLVKYFKEPIWIGHDPIGPTPMDIVVANKNEDEMVQFIRESDKSLPIYDQILSTFKFIEPEG